MNWDCSNPNLDDENGRRQFKGRYHRISHDVSFATRVLGLLFVHLNPSLIIALKNPGLLGTTSPNVSNIRLKINVTVYSGVRSKTILRRCSNEPLN